MKSGDFEGDLHVDVRLYIPKGAKYSVYVLHYQCYGCGIALQRRKVLGFRLVRAQIIMLRTSIRSCVIHSHLANCMCKINNCYTEYTGN